MPHNNILCIIGLGNPGSKYEHTRHNAGFWFVDLLAAQHRCSFRSESKFFGESARIKLGSNECWLLKPSTFMNRSGMAAAALCQFYKIPASQVLVVHDELDLPIGQLRLKKAGGHGGHNGLRDIISALGSPDFWRLRVGIGHPGDKDQVVDYVLNRASASDQQMIERGIESAADRVDLLLCGQLDRFMNELHSLR